jgi:hypothetical protein
MSTSAKLKEYYDTHGYVIIPGLLNPSTPTSSPHVVVRTR